MQKSYPTPDRRCYTLMVVPHRGNKVYRYQMPIRFVKACLATVGAVAVFAAAGFMHYQYTLHQAQADNAILLPQQAVTRSTQGDVALVVGADGSFQPRPIKIGQAQGNNWVVLEGLQAGEKVIVEGFTRLRPGVTKVTPVPAGAKPAAARPAAPAAATSAVPAPTTAASATASAAAAQ